MAGSRSVRSIEISPDYRYVIEVAAEGGSAYAMQLQKNPQRYVNLQRMRLDGSLTKSGPGLQAGRLPGLTDLHTAGMAMPPDLRPDQIRG